MRTLTPIPQHSEEEQARLMQKRRCFSYKKKGYTVYDYLKKGKITAILENVSEENNSQGKK